MPTVSERRQWAYNVASRTMSWNHLVGSNCLPIQQVKSCLDLFKLPSLECKWQPRGQNQVSEGKRRNLDTKASKKIVLKQLPVSASVTETSCTLSGYIGQVMENSLGWGRWQNVCMMMLHQDYRKPSTDPPNPLTHAGKVRRDRWVNAKNFLQHTRV